MAQEKGGSETGTECGLTKGLVTGGLSCGQGETWFLRVKRRDLGLDMRSLDFVLSRPAVCTFSHQSLCAFMLVWRSPLRYLTNVVMEMRPRDDVVLSLKGKLPLRARWRQKSMMPLDASCSNPCVASSFCRHAVLGGLCGNAASHSSGRVRPSSVVRREKRRSACAVEKGWSVGVNGKDRMLARLRRGRPWFLANSVSHKGWSGGAFS